MVWRFMCWCGICLSLEFLSDSIERESLALVASFFEREKFAFL